MTRNRQLVRAIRLMSLLSTGRHRLETLSRETGVSTRTIRRDLAAFEEAHLPLRVFKDEDGQSSYALPRLTPSVVSAAGGARLGVTGESAWR